MQITLTQLSYAALNQEQSPDTFKMPKTIICQLNGHVQLKIAYSGEMHESILYELKAWRNVESRFCLQIHQRLVC